MNFTVKLPYHRTAIRVEVNREIALAMPVDQAKLHNIENTLNKVEQDVESFRLAYFMQAR